MFLVLNEIKSNCIERRFLLAVGAAAFILGCIFSFVFKYDFGGADGAIFILNPNKYVAYVLSDDFGAVKLIFTRLAFGAALLGMAFLLGFNAYAVFLNYALIIYKAYSAMFYFKFFVAGFGFHGFVIFVFLIFAECVCTSFAVLLVVVNSFACSMCDERFNIKKRLAFFCASLLIILIFAVYEAIFISVIVRPFNLLVVV